MSLIAEPKLPVLPAAPSVLIVDDEPAILEMLEDAFGRELSANVRVATNCREARRILATQPIDLLVADIGLPDGNGLSLIQSLRARQPLAQTIVITGSPSVDETIRAMRDGAADLLPKPFTIDVLLERARRALYHHHRAAKNEARIETLKGAVRRLNEARRVVAKKVDLLCNDLVGAYGELAGQLDQVRTQEGFRNLLAAATDLEQLLCHAMDWMLRQLGYSNIAVWLAGHEQFQLGAYMKHTIAGDGALIEAMRRGLLRKVAHEGMIHLDAAQSTRVLSSAESKLMPQQAILASHCTYLGESLAVVVLFRDGTRPFTAADAATLKSISPIFAIALAAAVRVDSPEEEGELQEPEYGPDSAAGGLEEPDKPKRRRKTDSADWWKNGEPPPF